MASQLATLGAEQLLPFEENERLWKVFVFRPASGRATKLEHRIFAKQRPDGSLAMITFAVHTPSGARSVRSNVVRVARLSREELERIVGAIREREGTDEDEEIDLSGMPTLEEQLRHLRDRLSDF